MTSMFSSSADFSKLLEQSEQLQITAVLHKAFIDVNEQGAEAAAATAIMVGLTSVQAPKPQFRANHPFMYFLMELNQYPLFMGRFMNKKVWGWNWIRKSYKM